MQVRRFDFLIFYSIDCYLVCTAAMKDEKTSTTFVKDGIKLLQKRSNPVELFVQKRVKK